MFEPNATWGRQMPAAVHDRLRGVLPGLALGDAVGAPFEGRARVARIEIEGWLDASEILRWTDDTHMALTLARVLLDGDGSLDEQQLGDAFAAAYADEPWRGYGAGPPQVFALAREGMPYVEAAGSLFGGRGSFGNGAAMRVAPVALAARGEADRAADLAATQARVTHTHHEAVDGAVFIARAVCLLAEADTARPAVAGALSEASGGLAAGPIRTAIRSVLALDAADDDVQAAVRAVGTGVAARESVPAAVAALLTGRDVRSTLVAAVQLGGDTDTIAAMAGALAGALYGAVGLPAELLARLESHHQIHELTLALMRH